MLVILSKVSLGISLLGIAAILTRKIPVLANLPEVDSSGQTSALRRRFKRNVLDSFDFSFEIFLQRILSKIKIFALKVEQKVDHLLKAIRQRDKSQPEKDLGNDEYWDKLKSEVEKDDNNHE